MNEWVKGNYNINGMNKFNVLYLFDANIIWKKTV